MRLSSGTVRRRRLLLVDPDAVYRAGLEEPLEMALWSLHAHADAPSALAWLEKNPNQDVDAIWCEAALRDVRAEELIARVRALRPGLPALIVSATDESGVAPDAIRKFSKRETAAAVRWLLALATDPEVEKQQLPYS